MGSTAYKNYYINYPPTTRIVTVENSYITSVPIKLGDQNIASSTTTLNTAGTYLDKDITVSNTKLYTQNTYLPSNIYILVANNYHWKYYNVAYDYSEVSGGTVTVSYDYPLQLSGTYCTYDVYRTTRPAISSDGKYEAYGTLCTIAKRSPDTGTTSRPMVSICDANRRSTSIWMGRSGSGSPVLTGLSDGVLGLRASHSESSSPLAYWDNYYIQSTPKSGGVYQGEAWSTNINAHVDGGVENGYWWIRD